MTVTDVVSRVTRPRPVWRRLAGPGAAWLGIAGVVGVMHVYDPNVPGALPGCPILAVTGFWCPGCGLTRCVHALAHGDIGTALARNPLIVVLVAAGLVALVLWTWRRWRNRPHRPLSVPPMWVFHAGAASIVAFWVLRNIPGWTWLSPL